MTRIAIVTQTTGTALWNPVLQGAQDAARNHNVHFYWNAPTAEGNIKAQITLLERLIHSGQYNGIILAPDNSLALMSTVQDALHRGIPVVVISSRLSLAPGHGLSYVLNNNAIGGKIAAQYLGNLLRGSGTIALLGIDPTLDGNVERTRSFESTLRTKYPGITIVARRFGSYNELHERQMAANILKQYPSLTAIVALNHVSGRGAWFTLLDTHKAQQVTLIGFDQDIVFDGGLMPKSDRIVEQNTYAMGKIAVQQILNSLHRKPVPPITWVEPLLSAPPSPTAPPSQPKAPATRP